MTNNSNKYPNHEEIRQIFNDTYNVFYKKWKDISNPDDWSRLMGEARELNKKYNCELCQSILLNLIKIIEDNYKNKENNQ